MTAVKQQNVKTMKR